MADVTAKLLWYRLTESSAKLQIVWDGLCFVAEAGGTVLNCIFVSWIIFGLVTFLFVTIAKSYEKQREKARDKQLNNGRPASDCQKCRHIKEVNETDRHGSKLAEQFLQLPNFEWLNAITSWLHTQPTQWKTPIVENLLTALTEESRREGGDLFLTFEAMLPVGDPPVVNITDRENSNSAANMILNGDIQLSGLQLSLTASDNSVSIHSNILLIVNMVNAKIQIEVDSSPEDMMFTIRFAEITNCDIKFSPYHQGVDYITDEKKLAQHVSKIFGKLTIPIRALIKPGSVPQPVQEETIQVTQSEESATALQNGPPKPPRSIEDKRLMVKLIKATRLNKRNIGAMDAYCIVDVDHPFQTHSTSVVKNTVNPYWDEHFLFDLGANTKRITFRVYGHSKEIDDSIACLGQAETDLETLRLNHGIRTVLPLESRPEMADPVSGSVTIEAFFVDSAEFEQRNSPDIDDVFAASVEPLLPLHNEMVNSEATPVVNGHASLSTDSLPGSSASKVIKTQTYIQRRSGSYDDNQNALSGVEKAESITRIQSDGINNVSEETTGAHDGIDIANAGFLTRRTQSVEDYRKHRFSLTLGRKRTSWLSLRTDSRPSSFSLLVITVYPNQSVTEVVMKELQERANRPKTPGQKTTSTIIITAATKEPVVRQPLVSLASVESLSDDSGGGTSNWDVSPQQSSLYPSDMSMSQRGADHGPQRTSSPQTPLYNINVPKIEEPGKPSSPKAERKSRFSSIKRRFTRTKDKKPRSHSIERSSGLDEHRYLDPNTHSQPLGQSQSSNVISDTAANLPPKKKFGGSLRKLFKKRSSSASRASSRRKNILNDLDRPISSNCDRLSIEGDRPDEHGSRSSFEKDTTPPHHRTLSPSSSNYSYGSHQNYSQPIQIRADNMCDSPPPLQYEYSDEGLDSSQSENRRHYSLPSQKRERTPL